MPAGLVRNVGDQTLGPVSGFALAGFVGRHGCVAGAEILAHDVWPGKIAEKPADIPRPDDGVQAVIHIGIYCNTVMVSFFCTGRLLHVCIDV